jgi:hypothetical protein
LVVLMVTFCMTLNPQMCRTLEVAPQDHAIVSVPECLKGGAIGSMTFTLEQIEWRTKGWRCIEKPPIVQAWRRDRGSQ